MFVALQNLGAIGGGRGIGRAIATACAQEGARMIVTAAREKAEIDEVASHIGGSAILADVTSRDDVRKLVDYVVAEFGQAASLKWPVPSFRTCSSAAMEESSISR